MEQKSYTDQMKEKWHELMKQVAFAHTSQSATYKNPTITIMDACQQLNKQQTA